MADSWSRSKYLKPRRMTRAEGLLWIAVVIIVVVLSEWEIG